MLAGSSVFQFTWIGRPEKSVGWSRLSMLLSSSDVSVDGFLSLRPLWIRKDVKIVTLHISNHARAPPFFSDIRLTSLSTIFCGLDQNKNNIRIVDLE